MVFAKEAGSRNDRIVASTQEEIRRLTRNGNALQSEAASSISSGLSIVGKIRLRGMSAYDPKRKRAVAYLSMPYGTILDLKM